VLRAGCDSLTNRHVKCLCGHETSSQRQTFLLKIDDPLHELLAFLVELHVRLLKAFNILTEPGRLSSKKLGLLVQSSRFPSGGSEVRLRRTQLTLNPRVLLLELMDGGVTLFDRSVKLAVLVLQGKRPQTAEDRHQQESKDRSCKEPHVSNTLLSPDQMVKASGGSGGWRLRVAVQKSMEAMARRLFQGKPAQT
jgi:hypothetical protein